MNNPNDTNAHRGLLFPVDGVVVPVAIRPDRLLDDLYREMRCSMVEIVGLAPGVDLWCDEEALLRRPPLPNRVWIVRRRGLETSRPLFGHVIALGRTDDGAARSLTLDEADEVLVRVVATSPALAELGDPRPAHPALAGWLRAGIDWRQ